MNGSGTSLLLVMPPQMGLLNGFAAGLISLANYVSSKVPKLSVDILDLSKRSLGQSRRCIEDWCARSQARRLFVGVTATTASYQSALAVGRQVKEVMPGAILIFGGPHPSADPATVLRSHPDLVDVIVVGEGEKSLTALLGRYPALDAVPGAAFLADGVLRRTNPSPPLGGSELDSIPITYRDNGLIGTPGKFDHVTYVSARGCPLRCAFCAVGNDRIRNKSISVVVRGIETLLDIGFHRIAIEDNFFAHSPTRTRDVCEALADVKRRRNGDFAWDCQTRVESLARSNTISLMAEAGCEAVYVGVESVHPEHLAYLNKTNNPTTYLRQLTNLVVPGLLTAGIDCYLNLQFGLPGESVDHERRTLEVLASLGKFAHAQGKRITVFPQLHVIYPGTLHFQQGLALGSFPEDVFESFTRWECAQTPILYWLGEHFAHGVGGLPVGILQADLLRKGAYEVDPAAVCRISAALRAINRLVGVRAFDYGDYIVGGDVENSDEQASASVAQTL